MPEEASNSPSLIFKSARWTFRIIGIISGALLLGYLNYIVISNWFGKAGPANIGSIEVSYVSMARFINDFGFPSPLIPGSSSWLPFWYFGFPFHVFYTPLLPILEVISQKILPIGYWESYRLVTGASYILAPVSLFLLGWKLSKSFLGGILSGALYSVGPTVFYWLNKGVYGDRISPDFLDPRRFTILVRWGEGPHTLSLVFLPLAILFFVSFLEATRIRQKYIWFVLGITSFGLVALTNAIGFFATIIFFVWVVFVKFSIKPGGLFVLITKSFIFGIATLGIVSFWYNLQFIKTFFSEGGGTGTFLVSIFPWGWLMGALLLFGISFLINKFFKNYFGISVALLWFIGLFSVVWVYYINELEILPQALRYNTEVDMGLSLVIGVLIGTIFTEFNKKFKFVSGIGVVFALAIFFESLYYIGPFLPYARAASAGSIDLNNTVEKKIADWLKDNVNDSKGERVFIPGNIGFYINYFTNINQLRGGLFQASTHKWPGHIHYQLATGDDSELALAWLSIMNAKYAVITPLGSADLYQEIKYPQRFESLKKVYESGEDWIAEVNLKKPELAKIVKNTNLKSIKAPEKADEKRTILAYVNWINNSSQNISELNKINNSTYEIKGKISKGESVLVQMTFDPGWSANGTVNGKNNSFKLSSDPLGFVLITPNNQIEGDFKIILKHSFPFNVWVGYIITTISLIVIFVIVPFNIIKNIGVKPSSS